MSNNIRIRTTPNGGDKYLKLKLEQDFDFIEILSLKITQEDAYRNFCSDYGVVVGRVIMNSGVGVPNAKVSIFIPISDIDREDDELFKLYPYESIIDKDFEGYRYNLLTNSNETNDSCFSPTGSFKNKRQVLDNDILLEVHDKYYKFTTTTNDAGDYMLFGIPLGQYLLHVDVDLSDIGRYSQKPYDFIRDGADPKEFVSRTKFKTSVNINSLSHIKSVSPVGVRIKSFWGNEDDCDIGITRTDIDLNYDYQPAALFMGSIFTDDEKNSINKNCRARNKVGLMEELKTGNGRIEMLRKNFNGGIERFDIQDSEIDDNGAFAHQIPMNLDYMITDEFGVLTPSSDRNKGIPTRSDVRFKISMGPDGDTGRLRTRASYLVPNNPVSRLAADYTFNAETKDESFAKMYWNKVYSVKNHITRFQPNKAANNRNFTGIKNIMNNGGNSPMPFNKMDEDFDALFSILCLIMSIIGLILTIFNAFIVPLINIIISVINEIIGVINGISRTLCSLKTRGCFTVPVVKVRVCPLAWVPCPPLIGTINPIPCLSAECQKQVFAPGCSDVDGLKTLEKNQNVKLSTGEDSQTDGCWGLGCGFLDCMKAALADALNVIKYDFYNDWLNGSLYFHLFKYKRRKDNKEKFCEVDCDDFDSNSENKCNNSYILDTCLNDIEVGGALGTRYDKYTKKVREGVIMSIDKNEAILPPDLYYGSMVVDSSLMYATDIISLGAANPCDWQGAPVIHNILPETTIATPENSTVFDEVTGNVSETGQLGLFYDLSCLAVTKRFCQNIGRVNELGVGVDETRAEDSTVADGKIDEKDIENFFIRDVVAWMNDPNNSNLTTSDTIFERVDYNNYTTNDSFYFYFGLKQGLTALTKLQRKYFTPCQPVNKNDLQILGSVGNVTSIGGNDGSVNIEIVGGTGPYTYSWVGPNFTNPNEDISSVPSGTYVVTVTDSNGLSAIAPFIVKEPSGIGCSLDSSDSTAAGEDDGEITVTYLGGLGPTFTTVLTNDLNATVTTVTDASGLVFADLPPANYTVTITDSGTNETCVKTIVIGEPSALILVSTIVNSLCPACAGCTVLNEDTLEGSINLVAQGGTPPYTFTTVGTNPVSGPFSETFLSLPIGAYKSLLTDSLSGDTWETTYLIQEASEMLFYETAWSHVTCNGLADGWEKMTVGSGTPPYQIQYGVVGSDVYVTHSIQENNGDVVTIGDLTAGNYRFRAIDDNGCEKLGHTRNIIEPARLELGNFGSTCGGTTSRYNTCWDITTNQAPYKYIHYRPRILDLTGKIVGGTPNYRVRWYAERLNTGTAELEFWDSADGSNANANVQNKLNRTALGIWHNGEGTCLELFETISATKIQFWQRYDLNIRAEVTDAHGCTDSTESQFVPKINEWKWTLDNTLDATATAIFLAQPACDDRESTGS